MMVKTRDSLWVVVVLLALLQGCAAPLRKPAVPLDHTMEAVIPGIPGARYWVDADIQPFVRDAIASVEREQAFLARTGRGKALPPANFLAVSGGGDNGAFGAGLLIGWTEAGDRPEFKGVTGISTGALIAPFAFLGRDYDSVLKSVYTSIGPIDVYKQRSQLAALFDDGLADTQPLFKLISKHITEEFLAKIATEYEKGRLLLLATTNLDARRPVVWNMGAIAASGSPNAPDLFRRIMLASAAIPGAFPPVMIDVEVDGKPFQEMHVDGGAMAQTFLYPPSLKVAEFGAARGFQRTRKAYIIRNARLDPEWATVERRTMSIAGRAVASLLHSQGIGDLYRIYTTAQRDGVDYNLAYISPDFKAEHKQEFDTNYMLALYDYGYQLARKGYPWRKVPPGLDALEKPQ
jgi:predicted acylesterase/phospholipase RssA